MTTAYCSLADVQELLGRSSYTSADTTLLTDLIPQAQAEIDKELGFNFQLDSGTTRTYRGSDTSKIVIDKCLSFTSVVESSGSDITSQCSRFPYNRNPATMLERDGIEFSSTWKYTITGNWGYTAVPVDIKRACALLTIHLFKLKENSYNAMVTTQSANIMYGMMRNPRGWPEDVCMLVDRYKPVLFLSTGR